MSNGQQSDIILKTFPTLAQLSDEVLRRDIIACWERIWGESPWQNLTDCPVNPNLPDISLVDHINCVGEMILATATSLEKFCPGLKLDRDYLITGVLLHDLSKMVEIRPGEDGPEFGDLNKHMPHGVYGAFVAMAQGFDTRVANIILSHTRLTGARPDSPEAVLLHYLDYGMADVLRAKDGLPLIMETGSTFGKK